MAAARSGSSDDADGGEGSRADRMRRMRAEAEARWRRAVASAFPWWRKGPFLDAPFPSVEGNSMRPLRIGGRCFEELLEAIGTARSSIAVEMYMWDGDSLGRRFAQALAEAARRGVTVRVLVDGYGARAVTGRVLDAVREAGADVRVFNPFRVPFFRRFFHRTHKKLLAVDGERAFCGGAGFSRHFTRGKSGERPWHDRMFELRGPVVAQLVRTFEVGFARWPRADGARTAPQEAREPEAVGPSRMRVLRSWPDAREIRHQVRQAANRSLERIWIGTPYLIPPRPMRRALRRAARRGVDVRLVVPAREGANRFLWYASRRHYGSLLRAGARIFEFGPAFYHAKLSVVDRAAALVGSSNLDNLSWRRNAELDVLLLDAPTIDMVADCYLRDEAEAQEVTLKALGARGLWHRAMEAVAGALDEWL